MYFDDQYFFFFRQGLWSAEFAGQKFTKQVQISVKDVHIRKESAPCAGRKFWTQRATASHQHENLFFFYCTDV